MKEIDKSGLLPDKEAEYEKLLKKQQKRVKFEHADKMGIVNAPEILDFDKVFDKLPSNGWLSKAEAKLLWDTALVAKGKILEVGCYQGRSTVLLAATGRLVYCVDPFDGFNEGDGIDGDRVNSLWQQNMTDRKILNVMLFREKIETWRPEKVGMSYLDGDHTYEGTKNQIRIAMNCAAEYLAIHDVNDSGGGLAVKTACLEMLGEWKERVERLAVWELRKNDE